MTKEKSKILVIGSAHLDILAYYNEGAADAVHKPGEVKIGVGGVAFNIVSNLIDNGYTNTSLYTVVKSNSFSGTLIKQVLLKRKYSLEFFFDGFFHHESGFVAHNSSGKLVSGVASTVIDAVTLNYENLEKAIKGTDLVVFDCNLNRTQIYKIIEYSTQHQKPIFVCSVSEGKVGVALNHNVSSKTCYKVFCLNNLEASNYIGPWQDITNNNTKKIRRLCERFSSEIVVITNSEQGFSVFSHATGTRVDYPPPPNLSVIESDLGAGDALLSAIVAHYSEQSEFFWAACTDLIHDFVLKVLRSPLATPHADVFDPPVQLVSTKKNQKDQISVGVVFPFKFAKTFDTIKSVCDNLGLACKKGDDIWERETIMGDIVELITKSDIIIADYSEKNSNVMLEVGMAYILGKQILPIAQSMDDIPFDLRDIRTIKYHPTKDGYRELRKKLQEKIESILLDNAKS